MKQEQTAMIGKEGMRIADDQKETHQDKRLHRKRDIPSENLH